MYLWIFVPEILNLFQYLAIRAQCALCAQSRNQLICQFWENGPKPIFCENSYPSLCKNAKYCCFRPFRSRKGPYQSPSIWRFQKRKGKNPYFDLYFKKGACPASEMQFYQKISPFHTDTDSFFWNSCHFYGFRGPISAKNSFIWKFWDKKSQFQVNFSSKFYK